MQVVALSTGFYAGHRRRVGDIFEMDDTKMKQKDGKPVLPKWVKAAPDPHKARQEAEAARKAEHKKQEAGAIAASGGAAAKKKAADLAEQLAG